MTFYSISQMTVCCLFLCCTGIPGSYLSSSLWADEIPLKNSVEQNIKNEKKQKTHDQRKKSLQKKDIKNVASDQKLPVESIIAEMKRAGNLIKNQQTGKPTQKIQTDVIADIENLIQQIESAQKFSVQIIKRSDRKEQSDKKQTQKMKEGKTSKSVSQLSQGPARKSSERIETGQVTTGNLSNSNSYVKDAWGHLPPAMRQRLLNIYTEKFLPQYEDQVRRYYEALAEKKKQSP